MAVLGKIKNAGSVFLGPYTPVAAGDYASGTNHVLPTSGYARVFSGLNVDSFVKKITVQKISKEGLKLLSEGRHHHPRRGRGAIGPRRVGEKEARREKQNEPRISMIKRGFASGWGGPGPSAKEGLLHQPFEPSCFRPAEFSSFLHAFLSSFPYSSRPPLLHLLQVLWIGRR